ncbi:ATP-binding protein [Robertmurraya sp. DFI.2.37]|uniref:AIR synthase related protein n=1 Tax=Robertmurraya sp. DFI.2.37 TaxID=3031819 RepID=UPI0012459268|nr:AIR synthase related protein [Robertmurraya sp. DFI.2.37]MDF1508578.1 ATP-binding protein [Robertmurraya sp. DFI.2.37]
MRNALVIPIGEQDSLVITTDNSGGIGMKGHDLVKVAYDIVGYFSFRVAVMECLAAGAKPFAVAIHNFCGEDEWEELVAGVEKGLSELGIRDIQITGSTESNFPLMQSAVGLNVIGMATEINRLPESSEVALIGLPLVGNEVMEFADQVAPLSLFYQLSLREDVTVWPIGSKGIAYELEKLNFVKTSDGIDFFKSGGPATSFLLMYPKEKESELVSIAGQYFHFLK